MKKLITTTLMVSALLLGGCQQQQDLAQQNKALTEENVKLDDRLNHLCAWTVENMSGQMLMYIGDRDFFNVQDGSIHHLENLDTVCRNDVDEYIGLMEERRDVAEQVAAGMSEPEDDEEM